MKFLVGSIAAIGIFAIASPISAAQSGADGGTPKSVGSQEAYVIVDPAEAEVTERGTFYPTGEIGSDTLVIIPDSNGALGGLPAEEVTAILEAGGTAALQGALAESQSVEIQGSPVNGEQAVHPAADPITFFAPPLGTGPIVTHPTQLWGLDDSTRVQYGFGVTSGSNQAACGSGRGYYRGYNGSEFGVWSQFYAVGCASGGGTSGASAPWGNVAANPAFRAQSTTVHAASGTWWF